MRYSSTQERTIENLVFLLASFNRDSHIPQQGREINDKMADGT
jgi:hypothetical protein